MLFHGYGYNLPSSSSVKKKIWQKQKGGEDLNDSTLWSMSFHTYAPTYMIYIVYRTSACEKQGALQNLGAAMQKQSADISCDTDRRDNGADEDKKIHRTTHNKHKHAMSLPLAPI